LARASYFNQQQLLRRRRKNLNEISSSDFLFFNFYRQTKVFSFERKKKTFQFRILEWFWGFFVHRLAAAACKQGKMEKNEIKFERKTRQKNEHSQRSTGAFAFQSPHENQQQDHARIKVLSSNQLSLTFAILSSSLSSSWLSTTLDLSCSSSIHPKCITVAACPLNSSRNSI
jgi:hypothetical protein